jgi:hypothetical protein
MQIFELSDIAGAIHVDPKYGTIIGKGAADFGVTTFDLAEQISHTVKTMDVADAVKAANWYFDAHNFAQYLSQTYNTTVEIAAGIIAAVSPRMPWLRNKVVAESILAGMGALAHLSAMDAAKEIGLGLSANVSMAIKIARGADISDTLTGIKRRSFFNNIVDPSVSQSVTVDTWMMVAYCHITGQDKKAALDFIRANEKALKGTGVGYFLIADAVRIVANEMNLLPHQVQAMYWTVVAGDYNGSRTDIH